MKKKIKKFCLIKGTIYPFDVLITTASDEELYKYIETKKNYKLNDEEKEKLIITDVSRTVQLRGGQTIVRIKPTKTKIGIDLGELVHELEHAVFFILTRIGISHTEESDEAFAYFQYYLLKQALNFYDKLN